MPTIHMPRVVLVPATVESLRAELEGRAAFATSLDADVSDEWPPELYDESATKWSLAAIERLPGYDEWGMYYVLLPRDGTQRAQVIGTGGFKGPPSPDGIIEIGYSILPAQRRRGYAREAVDGWLGWGFADARVERIIAHTLTQLVPSIGVLNSAGFTFAGRADDPDEPDAIRYEIRRETYDASAPWRSRTRIDTS